MPSPLCLVASFLLAAAAPPTDTSTAERHLCECAGVPTDADGLLLWLRLRTPGNAAAAEVERLVSQLGDDAFAVRTAAFDRLKRLGALAVPALRKRAKDADLEVRRGVERLLALPGAKATESSRPFASVERAAVKLLAARPREETAAVLLAYLPHAESEEAHDEVYATLDVLREAGLGLKAMRTALTDASPVRRAAAGCVLARRGEARELLRDKDALVRLRTAQGMLSADAPDAKSLPTLIDLVGHESRAVSWQAEELLRYAAGPTSPKALVGGNTPGERKACEAAWRGWWKATGATIDLRGLHRSERAPGLTLLVAGMPDAKVADRVYLHVIGGTASRGIVANCCRAADFGTPTPGRPARWWSPPPVARKRSHALS